MDSMHIIIVLLVILILLAFTDLLRQYQIKSYNLLHQNYMKAVKWSNDFWKLGYRIEDLELKVEFQSKYWSVIKHQIQTALSPKFKIDRYTLRQNTHNFAYTRQSRIALHNLLQNDTSVYVIRCGDNNGPMLRIGVNDFRTDKRDACQIYTSTTTSEAVGPHRMFELISFDDATFALKSISNGKFVKTVPPPSDNPTLPWKLVIGGNLVGSAEKFRITDTGKLYSSLMGKFDLSNMIKFFEFIFNVYSLYIFNVFLIYIYIIYKTNYFNLYRRILYMFTWWSNDIRKSRIIIRI